MVRIEVNLHILLLAEISAETSHGGTYAKVLQF
jgi:hypothetical protein